MRSELKYIILQYTYRILMHTCRRYFNAFLGAYTLNAKNYNEYINMSGGRDQNKNKPLVL